MTHRAVVALGADGEFALAVGQGGGAPEGAEDAAHAGLGGEVELPVERPSAQQDTRPFQGALRVGEGAAEGGVVGVERGDSCFERGSLRVALRGEAEEGRLVFLAHSLLL